MVQLEMRSVLLLYLCLLPKKVEFIVDDTTLYVQEVCSVQCSVFNSSIEFALLCVKCKMYLLIAVVRCVWKARVESVMVEMVTQK